MSVASSYDSRGPSICPWLVHLFALLSCPSISIGPWVVHLSRVGHLGPQREIVAQELHDERGVLVRLFAQRVEVRDRVVERLPRENLWRRTVHSRARNACHAPRHAMLERLR